MTIETPAGRVLRDHEGVRLELERTSALPPAQVWAGLADPDRLALWFGRWTGDPAQGTVQLSMVEAPEPQTVLVRECRAPERLAVDLPGPDGTWPLRIDLEPTGEGTVLRFVHRLEEPYDASSIGPGWHYYLDRLEAVLADEPVPQDWDAYAALAGAYGLPDQMNG